MWKCSHSHHYSFKKWRVKLLKFVVRAMLYTVFEYYVEANVYYVYTYICTCFVCYRRFYILPRVPTLIISVVAILISISMQVCMYTMQWIMYIYTSATVNVHVCTIWWSYTSKEDLLVQSPCMYSIKSSYSIYDCHNTP